MTDTISSPSEYIEARFREYFRDASAIAVELNDDETITVSILYANDPEHLLTTNWLCEIGSDDDWYVFESLTGSIITLPLMADALEL